MSVSAATQLEVAAQWLREAAMCLPEDYIAAQLNRVADDCMRVARRLGDEAAKAMNDVDGL